MTATAALKETQTLQVLKKEILRSTSFGASPLRCHGSCHPGLLGRKCYLLFIRTSQDLQNEPLQEGISHDFPERYCTQSKRLAERLHLTIMDKVCCMLIDANLTPKLWSYAARYAVPVYNNLPRSAFDSQKSLDEAYADSSDLLKLCDFGRIVGFHLRSLSIS